MPLVEITRGKTAGRTRLLSVDSYDVSLDLTRGDQVFGSVSAGLSRSGEACVRGLALLGFEGLT